MDFEDIVSRRYATKKFDGRAVDEKTIERLLEMIRLSPSSYNLQPWKIMIIKDTETKELLFPASRNQLQITTCSHLLVFCADTDIEGLISLLEHSMREAGIDEERIQQQISHRQNVFETKSEQERLAWAQCQVYLCLGNALNGAVSLGLDACPMVGFEPKEYSRILGLPAHLTPTVLCPIGYAADIRSKKVRFPLSEIVL